MLETLGFIPQAGKKKASNPIRRLQQGGLPLQNNYLFQIPFTGRFTFHQSLTLGYIVSVALSRSNGCLLEDHALLAKSGDTLPFCCPDFPPFLAEEHSSPDPGAP